MNNRKLQRLKKYAYKASQKRWKLVMDTYYYPRVEEIDDKGNTVGVICYPRTTLNSGLPRDWNRRIYIVGLEAQFLIMLILLLHFRLMLFVI